MSSFHSFPTGLVKLRVFLTRVCLDAGSQMSPVEIQIAVLDAWARPDILTSGGRRVACDSRGEIVFGTPGRLHV